MIQSKVVSFLWIELLIATLSCAFLHPSAPSLQKRISHHLNLVPLSQFQNELRFFSETDDQRVCIQKDGTFASNSEDVYQLSLAEEADLPDVAKFVVTTFGADAINISQDLNTFESMLMKPAVELVNGYSGIVAFAEVLAGLRSRLKDRFAENSISPPPIGKEFSRPDKIGTAATHSIVLVLGKGHSGNDWHIDVIGSVELKLELCDAKIPFTLPWLDRIERRIASLIGFGKKQANDLQPYLSNLCVDPEYRGKGIGRALVRCVEDIASTTWGYKRMYLHVDVDNEAALKLYKTEGYQDVGLRWKPFWAGKAAEIGYYVKNLTD